MKYSRLVKIWLVLGVVMLFFQIVIGGITRITGSGLSITKWEIITGTLPPLSETRWLEEFDLYKETPQFEMINMDMKMGSIFKVGTFKFIYFWEYLHRLWARMMGFVFLFPFIFFVFKSLIDKPLIKRLGIVIILTVLAASFGWIMVASGLIERPWVNAYKLALHLSIGISVYAAMLWTTFYGFSLPRLKNSKISSTLNFFLIVLCLQIFFGGVMSGMKAGLFYPTWPDMNGSYVPEVIFNSEMYTLDNFNNYDKNELLPGLIQSIHRLTAYLLFFFGLYVMRKIYSMETKVSRIQAILISLLLVVQMIIGILTVINCQGSIPILYGILHQIFAIFLLSSVLWTRYTWSR